MSDLIKRLRLQSEHIPVRTLFDDAADRIEELVKDQKQGGEDYCALMEKHDALHVKLAIAVEGLRKIADHKHFPWDQGWIQKARIASAVLAELEKTE